MASEKDALKAEAKALGVKGYSGMNVQQLTNAIAKAKGALGGGAAGEPEKEHVDGDDVDVSKDASSIKPTGKFEVVQVSDGKFRMFNENGQAVSPIVEADEKDENGRPALAKLHRQARRSNALNRQRQIRTPKGHAEK